MNSGTRIALVTGCSRAEGIGFEVCRQLAQQNITVLLTARDAAKAMALADVLREQELDVSGYALDIASSESTNVMARLIDERYGRLDILVNNATGSTRSPAPSSTADLDCAQQVLDVTLFHILGNFTSGTALGHIALLHCSGNTKKLLLFFAYCFFRYELICSHPMGFSPVSFGNENHNLNHSGVPGCMLCFFSRYCFSVPVIDRLGPSYCFQP